VPALRRSKRKAWHVIPLRIRGVRCAGIACRAAAVHSAGRQGVSDVAHARWFSQAGSIHTGRAKQYDGMQSVTSGAGNASGRNETRREGPSRSLLALIAVFAVAGIAVSGLSLQRHYAKSATSFCEVGEKFDCDIVNRSEYSSVMGIPVAGIGVAGYVVLLVLTWRCHSSGQRPGWLFAASAAGLEFALYLTYVEAYVLATWCILCLCSLGVIAAIFLLAGVSLVRSRAGS
jgi:vitamin-K-epoxide reductase (warfarin-sensitive)